MLPSCLRPRPTAHPTALRPSPPAGQRQGRGDPEPLAHEALAQPTDGGSGGGALPSLPQPGCAPPVTPSPAVCTVSGARRRSSPGWPRARRGRPGPRDHGVPESAPETGGPRAHSRCVPSSAAPTGLTGGRHGAPCVGRWPSGLGQLHCQSLHSSLLCLFCLPGTPGPAPPPHGFSFPSHQQPPGGPLPLPVSRLLGRRLPVSPGRSRSAEPQACPAAPQPPHALLCAHLVSRLAARAAGLSRSASPRTSSCAHSACRKWDLPHAAGVCGEPGGQFLALQ